MPIRIMTIRHRIYYIVLIAALCTIGFRGVPTHPWSYDDLDHMKFARLAHENLSSLFAPNVKEPLRFVLNTYFYLTYPVFGPNPSYYHIASITLHAVSSLLLAWVYLSLFKNPLLAGLTGLLFAIHGTHYEAVYHISSTAYPLSAGFAFAALLCTHRYRETQRAVYIPAIIAAYAASLFSFEGAIAMAVPIAYLWWEYRKRLPRIAYWIPIGLCLVIGLFVSAEKFIYNYMETKAELYSATLGWHIPHTFLFFVGRLFINAHITPLGWTFLPPKDVPRDLFDIYVVFGGILLLFLLYLSRKPGPVRLLTIWLLAVLLPYMIGLDDYYYTRYFYLPAAAGAGLSAWAMVWIWERIKGPPALRRSLALLFLCLLIALSLHKLKIYEGYFLINTANFHANPNYRDDPENAIKYYERVRSEYGIEEPSLFYNLGICYRETGRRQQALAMFREAQRVRSSYTLAYEAEGETLSQMGRLTEAIDVYARLARINPAFLQNFHDLGTQLYEHGYKNEAIHVFREALKIAPDDARNDLVYFNLGAIHQNTGETDEAIRAYRRAVACDTEIAEVYQNLGSLLVDRQEWDEAVEVLRRATELDTANAQTWSYLSRAYEQTDSLEAAQTARLKSEAHLSNKPNVQPP